MMRRCKEGQFRGERWGFGEMAMEMGWKWRSFETNRTGNVFNVPSASHPAPDTDADWEESGTGRRMNVSR